MNKTILITSIVVVTIISILGIIFFVLNNQANQSSNDLLKSAGIGFDQTPPEYGDAFAAKILNKLITPNEVSTLGTQEAALSQPPQSTLFDYGSKGKLLSLQDFFNLGTSTISVVVSVDTVQDTELRYKIDIGSDYSDWELVKKTSSYPNIPFARAYVLVQRRGVNGRMAGLSYYEGSIVDIDYQGFVDDSNIAALVRITSNVAQRQIDVYNTNLKSISEGTLFATNPVLSRPDLPDPDITK